MTVSSGSSETGTIRPSSPQSQRTPLIRSNTTPQPTRNTTTSPKNTTANTERKPKPIRTRTAPLVIPKCKPPVFPDPLPANAVILHHRGKAFLHIRPPTPIPLRPSTPVGLRGHAKLPSTTIAGLLDASPLSLGHSQESSGSTSIKEKKSKTEHTRSRSDLVVLRAKGLPPIPSSPSPSATLSRRALSNYNGALTPVNTMKSKSKRPAALDITNFLDFDLDDKENFTIPTIPDGSNMSITPNSAVFPSSIATSDAESAKSNKSIKNAREKLNQSPTGSSKSVRWAEIPLFPEQQALVNIHGLVRSLLEDGKDEEILKAAEILKRFLPQPGVLLERKYILRASQEEELEHSLRILDGALFRHLDKDAVGKARKSLLKLAPSVQQRFATLPYHREVQRLKSERSQLKEDRSLVLVQLAIQEAEIKTAQARREAERNREIEEAALRRLKRREEKLRERKTYDTLRATLETRSKELKEVGEELEKEVKRLVEAREERDKRSLERGERGLKRIQMTSVRAKEGIKCWI